MNFKRIFALLLSFALVFSMSGIDRAVLAQESTTSEQVVTAPADTTPQHLQTTEQAPNEEAQSNPDVDESALFVEGEEEPPAEVSVESVTIQPESLSLLTGETGTLNASVSPAEAEQSVTWSSTNTDVATVDATSGLVTAVAAGTATITATSTEDTTKTASITVTVQDPVVLVTGISFEQSEYTKYYGEGGFTLTPTVSPANATNKSLTWTNSNGASVTMYSTGTGDKATLYGVAFPVKPPSP